MIWEFVTKRLAVGNLRLNPSCGGGGGENNRGGEGRSCWISSVICDVFGEPKKLPFKQITNCNPSRARIHISTNIHVRYRKGSPTFAGCGIQSTQKSRALL